MSLLNKDSKYFPLHAFLRRQAEEKVEMSFGQIERLLADSLPRSARSGKAFWSNRESGGLQSTAWMEAGYHVASVDLKAERVVFEQPHLSYVVERREGEVMWNAPAIRALRDHLTLNQQGMADLLGGAAANSERVGDRCLSADARHLQAPDDGRRTSRFSI